MNHIALILIFFTTIIYSCNRNNSFKDEISNVFEKGTDSTFKRRYQSTSGYMYYYTKEDETLITTTHTSAEGILIITEFSYFRDSIENIHLNKIETYFVVDEVTRTYGHHFDFLSNNYGWVVRDNLHAKYVCEFDSNGIILNEEGSVRIDGFATKNKNKYELLFTTVFHDIDSVKVFCQNDTSVYLYLELKESMLQPFLIYANFDYDILRDSVFYVETYTRLKKENKSKIYYDTLHLEYYEPAVSSLSK